MANPRATSTLDGPGPVSRTLAASRSARRHECPRHGTPWRHGQRFTLLAQGLVWCFGQARGDLLRQFWKRTPYPAGPRGERRPDMVAWPHGSVDHARDRVPASTSEHLTSRDDLFETGLVGAHHPKTPHLRQMPDKDAYAERRNQIRVDDGRAHGAQGGWGASADSSPWAASRARTASAIGRALRSSSASWIMRFQKSWASMNSRVTGASVARDGVGPRSDAPSAARSATRSSSRRCSPGAPLCRELPIRRRPPMNEQADRGSICKPPRGGASVRPRPQRPPRRRG